MMGAMAEAATTVLDAIALLAVAAGLALVLQPMIGWWSVVVAGCVILAGSQLAAWGFRRRAGDRR